MKTTNKHFELFKKACKRYIKLFGLDEWDFYYKHNRDSDENMASVTIQSEDRIVSVTMYSRWHDGVSFLSIDETAKHEMLHIVLNPLVSLISARGYDECQEKEEVHALINKLMKLI